MFNFWKIVRYNRILPKSIKKFYRKSQFQTFSNFLKFLKFFLNFSKNQNYRPPPKKSCFEKALKRWNRARPSSSVFLRLWIQPAPARWLSVHLSSSWHARPLTTTQPSKWLNHSAFWPVIRFLKFSKNILKILNIMFYTSFEPHFQAESNDIEL